MLIALHNENEIDNVFGLSQMLLIADKKNYSCIWQINSNNHADIN